MPRKPSNRLCKNGCGNPVSRFHPKTATFCSHSCNTKWRMAHGWAPHKSITPEIRAEAARKGGLTASRRRKKQRMVATVEALWPLVEGALDVLEPREAAKVKVALGRAYLTGWQKGYASHQEVLRERAGRQKGQAA